MPIFQYRARNVLGEPVEGELESTTEQIAKEEIASQGLYPIVVRQKGTDISFRKILFQPRVTSKDLARLTQQFQVMFAAGTPMERIFEVLIKQMHNQELKLVLMQVKKAVLSGSRLSSAFKQYPKYFSPLYISMLEVGETGGVLDLALQEMASIFQKEYELNAKIRSATLYPKIVLMALLVMSWVILVFVIPPFQGLYARYGADLPLPTQILIGLSHLITSYWYIAVVLAVGFVFGYRQFAKSSKGEEWFNWFALRVPVFGRLNILVANARFCHLVAALYRAGVPLAPALGVIASTLNNMYFSREILLFQKGLEHGVPLSKSMEHAVYFEYMVREACAVGERTGKLDELLQATAKFYDMEVDETVKNLAVLIEPILLVFLFGGVMLLALAVYLPIWNLSRVILPS